MSEQRKIGTGIACFAGASGLFLSLVLDTYMSGNLALTIVAICACAWSCMMATRLVRSIP